MGICTEQYRMSIGMFVSARIICKRSPPFSGKCSFGIFSLIFLNIVFSMTIILLLFAYDNDIESNPGPPLGHGSYVDSDKSHGLNICHLNIQSIQRNKEKIKHIKLQLAGNFEIITVSETWLTANDSNQNYLLDNYGLFRRDRNDGRSGGGVGAWVSDRLVVRHRHDLERVDCEAMWLEIRSRNNLFLLCVVYRPPDMAVVFWDRLQEMLDDAKRDRCKNIIILGDLNANDATPAYGKLNLFTNINHLATLVDEPTRITPTSQSKLDRILTNIPHFVVKTEVLAPLLLNDHCTITMTLRFRLHRGTTFKRLMWDYSKADFPGLRDYISNIDWSEILGEKDDIDLAATRWSDTILTAAKRYIPNREVIVRSNDKPWYNSNLRRLKRRVGRCHGRAKHYMDDESWAIFRRARNDYIHECRDAESLYESKRLDELSRSSFNTKECWSLYKSVLGIQKKSSYPSLLVNDTAIDDAKVKAETFNLLFAHKAYLDDSDKELPERNIPEGIPTIDHISITLTDVIDQLSILNPSKAYGPDGIGPRLLKELMPVIAAPLCELFQTSLINRKVPTIWKQATVIPIFKKGDKSDPNNYRPVSLLNTTSKVMEKIVFKYLFNFFLDNDIISRWQSGFMPGCSTTCQLLEIYHTFCSAVSDGKEIRVVFLDISRAFDRVWHAGLLHKLRVAGVSGNLLYWLGDYLRDRQQRVCIDGQFSEWARLLAGVPQGSVLGPLLFLIFINDVTHVIQHTQLRLFADDTCVFITVDNRDQATDQVNMDLSSIMKWSEDWLVSFSAAKTKSMVVSNKLDSHLNAHVHMSNADIDHVKNHKHLGLILSDNLGWNSHIMEIYAKAMKRLDIIQHFKFKLDRSALERYYVSYVLPILDYCDIVWSGANDRELDMLDKVQIRAMRIITEATERSNVNALYEDIGWHKLGTRRYIHRLIWMYKIINNLSPQYLTDIVPLTVGERQRYNLRARNDISQISAQKQRYFKSFFPSVIKEWNMLPVDIRELPNLSIFKRKLKLRFPSPTKTVWFGVGERYYNVHHARLRLGCSKLKAHLHFNLHVEDDPSCRCGHTSEDAYHYFCICPLYDRQRVEMLESISRQLPSASPRLSLLLRGDERLSEEENILIFKQVHHFMKNTKRFENS